jgi:hypothetical protein
MNISIRSQSLALQPTRIAAPPLSLSSLTRLGSRAISSAKRRREQVLAALAFVMLIVAWDATLRLDERVSPPRMRMSHAAETETETQMQVMVP